MPRYMMPRVHDDDAFDLFDDMSDVPMFGMEPLMKTDVTEANGNYVMKMDLPGYQKGEIKISLFNGNLTVKAEHKESKEEKDARGSLLRQERFSGTCERSFYVGKNVKDSDIHASFENGTLTVTLPVKGAEAEENKFIDIA